MGRNATTSAVEALLATNCAQRHGKMANESGQMRMMAGKYLRLATAATNPNERKKFMQYANLYREMTIQSEARENDNRCRGAGVRRDRDKC